MRPVGIAIVGCGAIAESKYLAKFSSLKSFHDAACLGFLGGRSSVYREKWGAPGAVVYQSMDELVSDERIDAVLICTPNNTHADLTVAALRGGKDVLCEKPMALSAADAARMVRAAEESGRILTIGHQSRFSPAARRLHELCASGALGEIYYARSEMLRRRGVPTWGHFLSRERQGGGCLIDLGTHAIDLALWMLADFDPVYAMGATYQGLADQPTKANRWGEWDADKFEVEDSAFGTVRMAGGATLEIAASWALNIPADREDVLTLCGTRGGATLSGGKLSLNGVRVGAFFEETFDLAGDWETASREQLLDFLTCVRERRQPLVTARESLGVSRVLDALYRSAAEKRPVQL